jgi:integrase
LLGGVGRVRNMKYERRSGGYTKRAWVTLADGGRRQVRVTGRTQQQLADKLAELRVGSRRQTLADAGRISTQTYLEGYLLHVRSRVRPSTWTRYEGLIRTHIVPRIGSVPLGKLRPLHIQIVVDGMLEGGSAPSSAKQAYRVLAGALRQAVQLQLLAVSPASAVPSPRSERDRENRPHPEELSRIVAVACGNTIEGL